MNILEELSNIGIIPVVSIKDAKKAIPLAKALKDGGIPAAEVTFRTDAAEDAIKNIVSEFPDMLVGAGTILSVEQAKKAVRAGCKFIVSPGLNPKVVSWCVKNKITVIPGCTTTSEIEQAIELGLNTVKFFPAEQSGGLSKIKALSAPYTGINFMPTGGISLNNLNEYLSYDKIIACGGSFMVKNDYIENNDWATITALSKQAIKTMLGFKLRHIGINASTAQEAERTANLLSSLLDLGRMDETEKGMFIGKEFELLKFKGAGKLGHIAIETTNVERAIYHLEKRGFSFNTELSGTTPDGRMKYIYLNEDFGGFAIHLILK